jgi:hypothetical protein
MDTRVEITCANRRGIRPLTVSPREAYELSGICLANIWKHIASGRLRSKKVDGRRLIDFDSLEQLVLGEEEAA